MPSSRRPDPGHHEGPKGPEKVLEVIPLYKILLRRRRIKEKEDEPKVKKATKVAAEKEKVNIPVLLPISSTKLGTRFSTSTTRRILDSASLSKADLARNRIAGSTTTVLVATKWEYRTKIAYAWLTSE